MSDEPFELEAQTSAELAAHAAKKTLAAHWPETLVQMMDVACAALGRAGLESERAEHLARLITLAQANYIGGRSLYLPRGEALQRALRDDAIYRAARRGNTRALAAQHGLTDRAIQKIIRTQTLLRRARMQPELPGLGNGD